MKIHPIAWLLTCLGVWLTTYSIYDPSWTGHANAIWFIHACVVHWDNLVGITPKDKPDV